MPAGLYCRISDDRTGQQAGVERQQAECEKVAAARGWQIAEVYVDNDLSAYSGRLRPAYQRLLADIEARRVGQLVVWHPDRLHRQPKELEHFIDLCEKYRLEVATVQAGLVDLTTSTGRMNARIVGAVARYESEHKADRIRLALRQNAERGKPGGGIRAFGYQRGGLEIDAAEAEHIRDAAARLLAGDSLAAVVREWNARGVPTVTGKPWNPTVLREILIRPRLAGLRSHRDEIIGPAQWPAVLPADTWHALRALFENPDRHSGQGYARVHLLSGIAECGLCGQKIVSHYGSRNRPEASRIAYACRNRDCPKVWRAQQALDVYVTEAALSFLEASDVRPVPSAGRLAEVVEQRHALEVRMGEAAGRFAENPDFGVDLLETMMRRFRQQIAALDDERARLQGSQALHAIGSDVRAEWPTFDLSRRRAIVSAVFSRIAVHPAPGKRVFDPTRVELVWR